MSQGELAQLVGVSQATISDYERGRRRPSLTALTALVEALGASPGWLLDRSAGPGGPAGPDFAGLDRRMLVSCKIGELLGVVAMPLRGQAALYLPGRVTSWQPRAGEPPGPASLAAEDLAPYAWPLPADQCLVIDRCLAHGADWAVRYSGPPHEGLLPGATLLVRQVGPQAVPVFPLFPECQPDWVICLVPGEGDLETLVVARPGQAPAAPARLLGRVCGVVTRLG